MNNDTRVVEAVGPDARARASARSILRESAAHTLAQLTDPAADLATLAEQARQSGALAAATLAKGRAPSRPDLLQPRP